MFEYSSFLSPSYIEQIIYSLSNSFVATPNSTPVRCQKKLVSNVSFEKIVSNGIETMSNTKTNEQGSKQVKARE